MPNNGVSVVGTPQNPNPGQETNLQETQPLIAVDDPIHGLDEKYGDTIKAKLQERTAKFAKFISSTNFLNGIVFAAEVPGALSTIALFFDRFKPELLFPGALFEFGALGVGQTWGITRGAAGVVLTHKARKEWEHQKDELKSAREALKTAKRESNSAAQEVPSTGIVDASAPGDALQNRVENARLRKAVAEENVSKAKWNFFTNLYNTVASFVIGLTGPVRIVGIELLKVGNAVGAVVGAAGLWVVGIAAGAFSPLFFYFAAKNSKEAHSHRVIGSRIKELTKGLIQRRANSSSEPNENLGIRKAAIDDKASNLHRFAKLVYHQQNALSKVLGAIGGFIGGGWGIIIACVIGIPAIAAAAGVGGAVIGAVGFAAFLATPLGWACGGIGGVIAIVGGCYMLGRYLYRCSRVKEFATAQALPKDLTSDSVAYKSAKKWTDRLLSSNVAIQNRATAFLKSLGVTEDDINAFRSDCPNTEKSKLKSGAKEAPEDNPERKLILKFIEELAEYKLDSWDPSRKIFQNFCNALRLRGNKSDEGIRLANRMVSVSQRQRLGVG